MRFSLRFLALVGCCAVLGSVLAGSPARAALIGDAAVPFSADRTVVTDGKTYQGRVYAVPGKQRHEQEIQGLNFVAVARADRRLAWVVLPDLKIYSEFAFPDAVNDLGDRSQLGPALGTETVGGQRTTKYHVKHQGSDGSAIDGLVWLTADGIVMRLNGTYTPVHGKTVDASLELSNLRLGAQPAELFDLPPGVKPLPPEAVQQLLGGIKLAKPHKS
ncbi:MAG TPA: hypothetical protein VNT30_03925 [Stellaceae bacterium]|nr:hypothetical protein [Stellaceae bacterium]